ncbi:sensor histidine kinase [Jidongwangia harbinensis]|uniref:sensor histidine kinase n=1 Tax=Jidongwangia harbinensis TaxID=2878561 RepID=UPI001CD9CAE0|nr:HAMP domain-containing sensor histidine kinase [Jidongwangia harbinensis]MCA2218509.1 HAMP domain-containing histidine kinase [Jidongwangia harbinensis]
MRVPGRRGAALALAVLMLGLTAGGVATGGVALAEDRAQAADLARRSGAVHAALTTTMQRYADTMHDLAARTATGPDPATAVAAVAADRLPGAYQLLIIGADRAVHHRRVLDGTTPPDQPRLRPGPDLLRALDQARASGRLVAGPPHLLLADLPLPPARRQPAFELAAPQPGPRAGWVVVSIRARDLLDAALHGAGVSGVSVALTAAGAGQVAHWSDGPPARAAAITADLGVAGQSWQVTVHATTPSDGAGPATAPLTMLAAAAVSTLAALIVLVVTAAHRAAAARARADRAGRTAAERRAEQAEQAARDREAELTGLATTAAESLHAPLHAIAGFTELLRDETPGLGEASHGFLDRIEQSTTRMLRVVDELRAYTDTMDQALRPEPVDTERLTLEVVAAHLDTHTGTRPSIDVGELPVVTADAALLRQVLEHLVDNAVRFVRHDTAARVRISAAEAGPGWWRIEVADRGIGVPEEHRARIFAPFHRAPAADGYPGTGLGLAVCRRIVDMHGGEIGVTANPGGGSVFAFTVSATGVTVPDALPALSAF